MAMLLENSKAETCYIAAYGPNRLSFEAPAYDPQIYIETYRTKVTVLQTFIFHQ